MYMTFNNKNFKFLEKCRLQIIKFYCFMFRHFLRLGNDKIADTRKIMITNLPNLQKNIS